MDEQVYLLDFYFGGTHKFYNKQKFSEHFQKKLVCSHNFKQNNFFYKRKR